MKDTIEKHELSNLDFGWKTPLGSWFFEFFDSKKMPSLWAFYWCWKKFHPTISSVWTHWTGGLQVIISTHTLFLCKTFTIYWISLNFTNGLKVKNNFGGEIFQIFQFQNYSAIILNWLVEKKFPYLNVKSVIFVISV